MNPVDVSPVDLAIASLLVLASAGVSVLRALGLARPLLWAAARLVIQVMLLGLVLRTVFELRSPAVTATMLLIMAAAASREVGARLKYRLIGPWNLVVGAGSVTTASVLVALFALTTALRPNPWYDPRYAIPLGGIILGNVLTMASVALDRFYASVVAGRAAIEAQLLIGATRREALADPVAQAARAGMLPMMNQMAAAGIVTLPGIMTGQIMAGIDPFQAARYQILLMFVIAGGGFLGIMLALTLATRRLSDDRHRLRLDRLKL